MSRIVTCLDCPLYQKGGYCGHYRKDVGALQPSCDHAKKMDLTFNPQNKDDDMPPIYSPTPQTKVCCACGRELPLDAFGKHPRAKDGLQSRCRECTAKALKDGRKKTDKEIQNAILMADTEAAMEPKKPTTARTWPRQDPKLENFESKALAEELRARGYYVKAERPITTIEEL